MTIDSAFDRLARLYGIELEYSDIWGKSHLVSDETKTALLRAMGLHVDDEGDARALLAEHEARSRRRLVDPVLVVGEQVSPIRVLLRLPEDSLHNAFEWTLIEEKGSRHSSLFVPQELETKEDREVDGTHFVHCVLVLHASPGPGYHRVEIRESEDKPDTEALSGSTKLIVTPEACYMPLGLDGRARVWGPAIQLFSLRSGRNWGIGDLTDLKSLTQYCADAGAGILGLNPLHSLFPIQPDHASPYSPSSRLFRNYLYIDVEAIPDFTECEEARNTVQSPEFQARLAALRDTELVDYAEVATAKRSILEVLYRHFRDHHLHLETERGQAFRAFQAAGGDELHAYGVFEALQEHFHGKNPSAWGWQTWPEAYCRPGSKVLSQFASVNQQRVEFFHYLHWQADLQLGAVGRLAMECGLKVGLYEDLPVSVDSAGFETWLYQDIYALQAHVGAPPDDFSLKGQDWGLPPTIPMKLFEAAYAPFIAMLRSNMRHGGAIRIDHVMQLMRLFWVPAGRHPSEGAYVRYPFRDLLGILALESQRNSCLVIGEDLGTVPDEVREALRDAGVLSYRLLYFEKDPDGSFKKPADYPEQALVAVSTHDLPTLTGYWQGQDLALRAELDLFPTEELREAQIIARSEDRIRLLFALKHEELLPEGVDVDATPLPEMSPDLITAIHQYLALSPAKIMIFKLEDVLGQLDQVNLPGTTGEYPNWRHKVQTPLERFFDDPSLESLLTTLRLERGSGTIIPPTVEEEDQTVPVLPPIPVATYRLQFNKDFNFAEAAKVVPYLRQLGISHCYTSPYLKARPGSTHGYDIVDHRTVNPELGSWEDFEYFVNTLHQHGMGQVIDIVPNHMAAGCDNPWWVDVLENGQASEYATFFDIAWQPLKNELRGKVLLPILEDQYGLVLEKGLLSLAFDAEAGEFSLLYYDHRFPIDPATYPLILAHGLERLESRVGAQDPLFLEFQTLITAFENLPKRWETNEEKVEARMRDKEVQKRQFARLCRQAEEIKQFVEENVVLFNGATEDQNSYDRIHELLQDQPFRLAYWRVASDDINYRRFFDINELAGLRMENRRVFEETHRFILDLIAQGKIQGLRIDHIDGLYDPQQYCQWFRDEIQGMEFMEPDLVKETADGEKTSAMADDFYLIVEKILAEYEQLRPNLVVQGTTGYDFANLVGNLFVDQSRERDMDRIYSRFIGRKIDFDELLYDCKKLIMRVAMASELNVLSNELSRIAESHRHTRDYTVNSLRDALTEVVAWFPVYRTYIAGDGVTAEDRRYVDWATGRAKLQSRAADISVYDFIHRVLLLDLVKEADSDFCEAVTEFTMKFQQFTGPVMAKGLEDTSLYVYNRLVSVNEVGGDPRRFGVSVPAFHHVNSQRATRWPHAMLNTSTHDSKRSEDVRARISVLSEIPDIWSKMIRRWNRLNRPKKQHLDTIFAPSKNDEYALYQILIGAWPFQDGEDVETLMSRFSKRVQSYMIKAVREAKVHSSWLNPNEEYEDAVVGFVRSILEPRENNRLFHEFLSFQRTINRFGLLNSLSQTLLKLTVPGVPDIYQGNEVWHLALVDPDNRRPVDFQTRRDMLQALQTFVSVPTKILVDRARELFQTMEDGRIKLYVIWKTLGLRWRYETVFRDGAYIPLATHGEKVEHLCAFARQHEGRTIIVVAPRLYARLCRPEWQQAPLGKDVWSDTWIEVPAEMGSSTCHNLFTGEQLRPDISDGKTGFSAGVVLAHFPVALLTTEQSGSL